MKRRITGREAVVLAVLVTACTKQNQPAADAPPPIGGVRDLPQIEEYTWMWVGTVDPVQVLKPETPQSYTLELREGRASGKADCNRLSGSYTKGDRSLTFGPLAMTRAMCPPGSLGDKYAGYFQWIRTWFVRGDTLYMDMMADGGTLRFVRAPAAAP